MKPKKIKLELDFTKLQLRIRSFLIVLPILTTSLLFLYIIIQYATFNPFDLAFITRSSKIYDTNGTFLYEISKDNAVKNTPINYGEVPKNCINAIVAIEDKTFWRNIGIDINGIGRLGISIFTGGSNGGGSTISQQVIKNAYQRIYNRNPLDKLNEMIFAVKLTQYYSKEEIVMMYLNNVYFGNLDYGIESASIDYFGKTASELDLAECSYIVGIPQWPGVYNPYGQIEKGKERQKSVLEAMVKNGYISEEDMRGALTQELVFNYQSFEVRAPHYIQYLQDKYGIMEDAEADKQATDIKNVDFDKPHKIYTYYDYELHKYALDKSKTEVLKNSDRNTNNAAVVVLDSNSRLLTMVGSIDFFNDEIDGKFNSAIGYRQPGTTLIPFVHISAYSNQIDPLQKNSNTPFQLTIIKDGKSELVDVKNFANFQNSSQSSQETLEVALTNNLVIPTVQLTQQLGVNKLADTLHEFNILEVKDTKQWCNEIAILEGCEMKLLELTQAYNIINHKGVYNNVSEIKEVMDGSSIIFSNDQLNTKNIDSSLIAPIAKAKSLLDLIKDNGWTIIKGDTRNDKDTIVIAYNDKYAIGVWVGNTKGEAMNGVKSDDVAIPILKNILEYFQP